jgi:transcriptional regulator with PAS, ATPase and Fis domain
MASDFVLDETARYPADARSSVRVLTVELVVLDGPAPRGTRVRIPASGVLRVGSAKGNELELPDRAVSRVHCELTARADRVLVKDLESTNGTWIGDVRVSEAEVPVGTVIRAGGSAFRVEASEDPTFVEISDRTELGELVGASLEMRTLYAVLERVSQTDTTLLIQGETGTGKDVAARSVHALSRRSRGPFVPIDCGAIPETLFESELFGHVRGAFTGAIANRAGAFEEASGGTLFLDEIGEMPLSMQAKLLRALETRRVRRVGSTKEVDVDVRIVAATNRKLAQCVNEGTFREDLYYRLAVVEVAIPPLRARRDDIPLLASTFYARIAGEAAEPLPPELLQSLRQRAWPGNVRELRNEIERTVALGQAQRMSTGEHAAAAPAVLPAGVESIVPLHLPLKEARLAWTSEFESIYVRAMLERTDGNLTRAAELAGVSRRFLQRLIARIGLRGPNGEILADDGDDD